MVEIAFARGALTASEQAAVKEGFRVHGQELGAPQYEKEQVKWIGVDGREEIRAILSAEILWEWMYVDELWVSPESRGEGLGKRLILLAEELAIAKGLQGVWLWTQSWQAVDFYAHLGFDEFARFDNFPQGHARVGFRKHLK